jgi:opacity protein-like surface antigen
LATLAVLIAAAISLGGCAGWADETLAELKVRGELTPHLWFAQVRGKTAGADLQGNLGYPRLIAAPDIDGRAHYDNHQLWVDWTRLSLDGAERGPTTYAGQHVPIGDTLFSSQTIDEVQGTYGYRFSFAEGALSLTPLAGVIYGGGEVHESEAVPPNRGGVPFPAIARREDQVGPLLGARATAELARGLELSSSATGFDEGGAGSVVDARLLAAFRYGHVRCDLGYRYAQFDSGNTSLLFRGMMVGLGVDF